MAIELMAACQGIEILRPLKTTEPLEAVHGLVRSVCKYVSVFFKFFYASICAETSVHKVFPLPQPIEFISKYSCIFCTILL